MDLLEQIQLKATKMTRLGAHCVEVMTVRTVFILKTEGILVLPSNTLWEYVKDT